MKICCVDFSSNKTETSKTKTSSETSQRTTILKGMLKNNDSNWYFKITKKSEKSVLVIRIDLYTSTGTPEKFSKQYGIGNMEKKDLKFFKNDNKIEENEISADIRNYLDIIDTRMIDISDNYIINLNANVYATIPSNENFQELRTSLKKTIQQFDKIIKMKKLKMTKK